MTENMTLPEGWAWASNLHDLHRGVAVSKVWWRNGVPHMRCQVHAEVDRVGQGRVFADISVAMKTGIYKKDKSGDWRWYSILVLHDMPDEPVAAAVSVELDYTEIEESVLKSAEKLRLTGMLRGV